MSGEAELAELRRDAARWRALMASQRMHFMGSSGFDIQMKDPKGPRIKENMKVAIKPDEAHHFGMEFWDEHSAFGDPKWPDDFERELLTLYVDALRERMK